MENNKLVDPFVITSGSDNRQTDPEQKNYLLLAKFYPHPEDPYQYPEDDERYYDLQWVFFKGRSAIRNFIIANIADFDPKKSYVLVEGSSIKLDPTQIPTVYQLFTDPRSSWNDPNLFPDGFNIDQAIENGDDNPGYIDSDNDRIPGESMTSAENVAMMMSAEGIDITSSRNKKEE